MFVCLFFGFPLLYAGGVLAKPLQIVNENTLSTSESNLVDAAFVSNISTGTTPQDSFANYIIKCDGSLYGFNPNIVDCERAAQYVNPDTEQLVWGERDTGLQEDIFLLPFAVFGDKAECAVKTIIHGDSPTARASFSQVRSAAAALSLRCAAGGDRQGGIATNIGGDNNLAVTLSTYEPNIHCSSVDNFRDAPSCGEILAEMPASTVKTRFGPQTIPGVQELLPQLFASGDNKCLLRLYSTGRADSASWYSIWEAAEATFARCARDRKSGSSKGLGDNGDIFLTLTTLPSIGLSGNSSQAAMA